jgi:translation initiation factor 1
MSKKKHQGNQFIVYSTNPDYRSNEPAEIKVDQDANKQQVRIWLERHRGGKEATVIKGLQLTEDSMTELAKMLKNKCAAGGNAKDGEIIIQGNHREKVLTMLIGMGYTQAKKAGG